MSILTYRPAAPVAGFLDRERTVAGPAYNRWLVPPARGILETARASLAFFR